MVDPFLIVPIPEYEMRDVVEFSVRQQHLSQKQVAVEKLRLLFLIFDVAVSCMAVRWVEELFEDVEENQLECPSTPQDLAQYAFNAVYQLEGLRSLSEVKEDVPLLFSTANDMHNQRLGVDDAATLLGARASQKVEEVGGAHCVPKPDSVLQRHIGVAPEALDAFHIKNTKRAVIHAADGVRPLRAVSV
ncbi:cysteine desulfurase, putative [Babesia ovata]|uniref:Cysteine desulfurase, putative n=1 Tax=Babesia ovata TaxID=189622 RepID=A0A2H6K952_9APIC|nr:cysteine desulfurase, putative [Babesia ovata]GBE59524.1 cysteine desulfurase, putative [Babesia ovata]